MRDPATIAAGMAAHVNSHAVSKAYGSTVTAVTADDMMPAAVVIADVEARIDQVGRDLADRAARLETLAGAPGALSQPDFPCSARPDGAAGPTDSPLDPIEIERVDRVITAMESDFK